MNQGRGVTIQSIAVHALIVLAASLPYAPAVTGEFVYDDVSITVTQNPAVTGEVSWLEVLTWDRPLREFTYRLDYRIWGMNPLGFHLQNLLWHAANAVLVFHLLLRMGTGTRVAPAAALLFAVHPVNTEAVAWISGRKELLCLFFELLACHAFLRADSPSPAARRGWFVVVIVSTVLALMSKQVAIMLPLLMALCAWASARLRGRPFDVPSIARRLAAPVVLVAASLVWYFDIAAVLSIVQQRGTFYDPGAVDVEYSALAALLTPFATWLQSAWLFVVPLNLTVERGFQPAASFADPRWIAGFAVMAATFAAAWKVRDRAPLVLFGWLWIFIAWAPLSGAMPVGYLMADRYLYIPAIGFCALAAGAAKLAWSRAAGIVWRGRAAAVLGCAVLLAFAARTADRSFDWRDGETLWLAALEANPNVAKIEFNLGNEYQARGEYEKAFAHWNRALELQPFQPKVWVNMGNAKKRLGQMDGAEACYRRALELDPRYGAAHFNLAVLLEERGNTGAALGHFQSAARHMAGKRNEGRRRALAAQRAGQLFLERGERLQAAAYARMALVSDPYHAPSHLLWGLLRQEDEETAREAFQTAIQLDPEMEEAWFNLGVLEWTRGDREAGERCLGKAAELNPELRERADAVMGR